MSRTLQLKWSDETNWRSVRELGPEESDLDALRRERDHDLQMRVKYPHHTFSAEFRVVDLSVPRFGRRLEIV